MSAKFFFRIEPSREDQLEDKQVISGWTEPFAQVEVGVNERLVQTISADKRGYFESLIQLPLQTHHVWVRTFDGVLARKISEYRVEHSVPLTNQTQPVLDLATYITDTKLDFIHLSKETRQSKLWG